MEARVRQVMAAVFGIDAAEIGPDAAPGTIEAWDSLRHMSLVIALEEEFGVRFTDADIEQMLSLPLICLTLRERTAGA